MGSTKKMVDNVKKRGGGVNLFGKKERFRLFNLLDFDACIGKNAAFNFL